MKMQLHDRYAGDAAMQTFVRTLPDAFDQTGEVLYAKRNTIRRMTVGATAVVVKRFKRPHLAQALYYSTFGRSKARRAFLFGQELLRRGIDTPTPIAFVETKCCGILRQSYYICGEDNNLPIRTLLHRPEGFDRPLARAFAQFAATLHVKGVLHGDLNSTNTLYRQCDDGTYAFSVIDINRMKFYPADTLPPLDECLENLTRFTGDMQLFGIVAYFYADTMAQRFGIDRQTLIDKAVATKMRHDERWRKRKSFLKKLKRKSAPKSPTQPQQ